MKTKYYKLLLGSLIALCLWGTDRSAVAQNGAPVYRVLSAGATAEQARLLASMLQVPFQTLSISNGQLFYLNPATFMAAPTAPVTDAKIINSLLGQTENSFPQIPIRFEQLDFAALAKLTVPADTAALTSARNAFGQSGLDPQYGNPTINHTMLTAFYVNENNVVISNRQALDTKINYQFTTPEGHRLIGPGAQVQLTFGPNGQVSQLLYAARKLELVKVVGLITPADAMRRAAPLFPADAKLNVELVYWSPPFWQPSTGRWLIQNLVPSYLLTATSTVIDPVTGGSSELQELATVVPATDDPAFVPTLVLTASVKNGTQVSASADVSGGQPPYVYEWHGSDPSLGSSNGPTVLYTPQMLVNVPSLSARLSGPGKLTISWPNDPQLAPALTLESTPSVARPAWKPINPPIATNHISVATVQIDPSQSAYFRLHLTGIPLTRLETIGVKVTDANGVQVQASQTLQVSVVPTPKPGPSAMARKVVGVVDWGTESPFDPGLGTTDRNDWTTGMILGGAGTQRFRWIDTMSWKEDFIDSPTGVNNAQVDNADITLYIGHGNPQVITFTGGPGSDPTTLFYNGATHSWGNLDEEWLCFLSCSVLQFDDGAGDVWQRWGPNFDGLHILTGFRTSAGAGTGFPFAFSQNMLGAFFGLISPMPIVNAWFAAAYGHGTGSPAAMGPIGPGGVWDYGDYFWGKGPVGPTIRASQIHGWWYAQ